MERTKHGELAWIDLTATDLDAQSAFYEALFDWRRTAVPFGEGSIYNMFSIGGRNVCGASQMMPQMIAGGVPSAWNTYIAVDDVDAALAKAIGLGAAEAMPATDVMGRGRFAAVIDPTGAAIFLWHATAPDPTMTYGEPGAFAWADLMTRDPKRAADFYSELAGWTIAEMNEGPEPYWRADIDGQGEGGIMPMPEMVPPQVPAYWLVYFATADLDAAVAKAKDLGATVSVEPMRIGETVAFAILEDPKGATFALLQMIGPM